MTVIPLQLQRRRSRVRNEYSNSQAMILSIPGCKKSTNSWYRIKMQNTTYCMKYKYKFSIRLIYSNIENDEVAIQLLLDVNF